jgi:hypothetical protein
MAERPKDIVAARCPKPLRAQLRAAKEKGRLENSEIVRSALEEFFSNHPTVEDQIDAVIRSRQKAAVQE